MEGSEFSQLSQVKITHTEIMPIIYQLTEESCPYPIDSDVKEEFFKLTCLAVKLNSAYMENVCNFSANWLFSEALKRSIPFQKFYVWIDAQLNQAYYDSVFKI